jgi:catechol 2,3-dioxygenase-like lactoylglutathione lyase family enzyme
MEIVMKNVRDERELRVHLALNTAHFDKSVAFYEALFDARAAKLKPGYAKFEPEAPRLNLTLNAAKTVGGNQVNHLGIEVKSSSDVYRQRERLKHLGLITLDEDNTTCCYAVQDKVWVQDPDGNAWEYFVVLEDSATEREAPTNALRACCG